MRYFFKFNFRWVRFAVLIMVSVLTFWCSSAHALTTDEIVDGLLVVAENRNFLDAQDSQFIHLVVEEYNRSLHISRFRTENVSFFKNPQVLDCFKYAVLLSSLGDICEACKTSENFCSSKCEGCLLHLIFKRTPYEESVYQTVCPVFYKLGLLKVNLKGRFK